MKITPEILEALQKAVSRFPNRNQFALKVGVPQHTLVRWLEGISKSISDANYERLFPLIKPYLRDAGQGYPLPWNFEIPAESNVPFGVSSLPSSPNTIRNTPELRECIKDAMLREGVRDASELNRRIGYDSSHSLERLLAGKLNWFPDVLSAVLDELKIKQDDAPISPLERSMLAPEGIYNQGAILVRPVPVVDWANAADYIGSLIAGTSAIDRKWDPESIETIPAPTGCRKDTIALRVHGQSMEPKIQDGDKIYCEPVENLEELPNNKIVVVRFTDSAEEGAGCLFCKRFRRIGGEIFLTSDNPAGRNFNEVPPIDIAWLGRVTGKYDDDF